MDTEWHLSYRGLRQIGMSKKYLIESTEIRSVDVDLCWNVVGIGREYKNLNSHTPCPSSTNSTRHAAPSSSQTLSLSRPPITLL